MDAAKVKSAPPAQDLRANKRVEEANQQRAREARARENTAVKNPYEQPKPTTNAQGQALGRRLNEVA